VVHSRSAIRFGESEGQRSTPSRKRERPEVAAAVAGLKTWVGYERQAEIVTKGLLASTWTRSSRRWTDW